MGRLPEPVDFFYKSHDGEEIFARHQPTAELPAKGVFLIAHGLGETADYYTEFGSIAGSAGFAVYTAEARGHGRTAGNVSLPEYVEKAGDIGDEGFAGLVGDLHALNEIARSRYPGLPVFLLAHSLGSVTARLYAIAHGAEIDGLILTGALSEPANSEELAGMIHEEIMRNGPKAPCQETFKGFFKEVNKQFEPVETELDWITSDGAMVRESLKLPYTYVLFNNQFYKNLLHALKEVDKEPNIAKIPKDLPIYLLSGGRDSITENGRVTAAQAEAYKKAGLRKVEYKIYAQCRHSILREKNRAEVAGDIVSWCEKQEGLF